MLINWLLVKHHKLGLLRGIKLVSVVVHCWKILKILINFAIVKHTGFTFDLMIRGSAKSDEIQEEQSSIHNTSIECEDKILNVHDSQATSGKIRGGSAQLL